MPSINTDSRTVDNGAVNGKRSKGIHLLINDIGNKIGKTLNGAEALLQWKQSQEQSKINYVNWIAGEALISSSVIPGQSPDSHSFNYYPLHPLSLRDPLFSACPPHNFCEGNVVKYLELSGATMGSSQQPASFTSMAWFDSNTPFLPSQPPSPCFTRQKPPFGFQIRREGFCTNAS
ncbi:hypothetical protein CDAR_620781 [Caerostris darwini]|uniref:Uncharacterized protein n=1 Tax=Caerostris darwini TaxID=1538125 RepID=A0AAV4USI8_9ARAC|nr:hypothetical protein CDAR_620781 [Caerostris darwini]